MCRRLATIALVALTASLCLFATVQAQILPPIIAPAIALKAAVTDGGKIYLGWEPLVKDTVKFYTVYRGIYPDTSKFTKIADSLTRKEYSDLPPRLTNATATYLYYVTGLTTKGTTLRSNLVAVFVIPPPPAKDMVRITSIPAEQGEVNVEYKYQVKAVSSDSTAKLSFNLNVKPSSMTIDSAGLIKWTPKERGIVTVEVLAKSSKGGSAVQRFAIRVSGLSGAVVGTVTDTTGTKTIPAAYLVLYKADATINYCYKAISDASGKYKFDGIDPGTYYMRIEPSTTQYLAQWYDRKSSQRDATPITVVANASTPIDVKLQSRYVPITYSVKGSVLDSANRAPLREAVVVFASAGFALNGSRGFAGDPTGAQDFRGVFDNDQSMDHRLDGANTTFVFKAKTDSMGAYLVKLPAGSYIAYAEAKGHIKIFHKQATNLLTADTIRVNANMAGIDFNLPPIPPIPLGEINGLVSDSASGRGIRARMIAFREKWAEVIILTPPVNSYVPRAYVVDTDSMGKYSFANVIPGQYMILALPVGSFSPAYYSISGSTQDWRKASRVAVNGNVVAGIDIQVKPFVRMAVGYTFVSGSVTTSSPSGRLGKSTGSVGVIGALVYATSNSGAIYGYDVTDERGAYAIAGAAPGSYSLFVDAPGYSSSSSALASPTYANDAKGSAQGVTGVNFTLNSVTDVEEEQPLVPTGYVLEQNFPNPFNPSTQILFSLPSSERVTLTIYNILGQKMAALVDGVLAAGTHVVTWNGRDGRGLQLPSGVYFYKLESSTFSAARKMLMLK